VLSLVFTGCTNFTGNRGTAVDITPKSGQANSGDFFISQALRSNADPNSLLDIIGGDSIAFSSLCRSKNGSAGSGESTCQCKFDVTTSSGSQSFEVPTVYLEDSLVRCRYDVVSAGASKIEVSVHALDSGKVSNKIVLGAATELDALDLRDPDSYLRVHRYQCNEYLFIPSLFGGSIYDPFQSENTVHQFPRNFYTTNLAVSAAALIRESNSNPLFFSRWDCNFNLNKSPYWSTPEIYSRTKLDGKVLISPHSGSGFNRELFYLAKKPSGVFNHPVNAFHAPFIRTFTSTSDDGSAQQGFDPPLGFGAKPIGGSCPSGLVDLPSGYKWVKVWSMRHGSSSPRTYIRATKQTKTSEGIFCNPGNYPLSNQNGESVPVFSDCGNGNQGNPITSLTGPNKLAGRIIGHQNRSQNSPRACVLLPFDAAGTSSVYEGADVWYRVGASNVTSIPWELGTFEAQTVGTPSDQNSNAFEVADLAEDNNQSPWDYLFVVSPPSITLSDMKAGQVTSQNGPYRPLTFKRREDCRGGDPTQPNGDDCKFPRDYEMREGEVGIQDTQGGASAFPVCAIAPTDGVPR